MGRVYLYSHLSAADWEQKAASTTCLVCDNSKQADSICCTPCWWHLHEDQQTQILNLLRQGRIGWALRKMCAWAGRAVMPTRKNQKELTAKLFTDCAASSPLQKTMA